MCFYEFSRIHYRGKTLEKFIHRVKNGCEQKKTAFSMHHMNCKLGKHFVFPHLHTLTFPENVCSAVYSDEYVVHLENVNKQKENTLFAVR